MNTSDYKTLKRKRRHARVRSKVSGTAERPRLTVFRSNTSIYAQLIDDTTATTLAQASDLGTSKGTKAERAQAVGKALAQAAKEKNISKVVFDRGGYLFAGRIKMLAEAARAEGLIF